MNKANDNYYKETQDKSRTICDRNQGRRENLRG